jgi:hypothetical protein
MIQRFQYWLHTDVNAKKKVLFIFISSLVVILIGYIIFALNTSTPRNRNTPQNIAQIVVTPNTFDSAPELVKYDQSPIGLPTSFYFDPENDDVYYVDDNLSLKKNGEVILSNKQFLPRQVNFFSSGAIAINEDFTTTLYFSDDNQTLDIEDGNSFLIELSRGRVYLAILQGNDVVIKETFGTNRLSFAQEITKINISDYNSYDLRMLNEKVYFFGYQNINRTGKTKIWEITQSGNKEVFEIENTQSWLFSKNKALYSTNIRSTQSQSFLLSFQDSVNSREISEVQNKLKETNVVGNIVAERCSFSPNEGGLSCLVKEASGNFKESKDKDVLADINLENLSVSFTKRDLVFSASAVHISPKGKVFIISQEGSFIYKIEI